MVAVTEPKRSSAIKLGQVVLNLPYNNYTQYSEHYQSCRLGSLFEGEGIRILASVLTKFS